MKEVILYSTNCPQCKMLKAQFDATGIAYNVCSDVDEMRSLGITSVPVLGIDGQLLRLKDALSWVKEHE